MPRLSALFVRAALLYLLLGFTIGALLLGNKGVPFYPQIWRLLPAHMEFLLMGWIAQLAMGVAYWILPRFRNQRPQTGLVWLAFGLLNGGIWLVALSGFWEAPAVLQVTGRLLEGIAAVAFALHAWRRIKPAGA